MVLFSERYGYIKPSDVIIKERITEDIKNAILSCFDELEKNLQNINISYVYSNMDKYVWVNFLNQRLSSWTRNCSCITTFIEDDSQLWYKKLDMIEVCIKYLHKVSNSYYYESRFTNYVKQFIVNLRKNFKRLNFGYNIVNNEIIEITSEEEISAIETALAENKDNVRLHLGKALELYSQRPIGDFRNSIKESISAVEAFCRERTGQGTLGKALNQLENEGIIIPNLLKTAFEKLYAYTNQPDTGIRHALMDDKNMPQCEEALFMLISCSAFINYLRKKVR